MSFSSIVLVLFLPAFLSMLSNFFSIDFLTSSCQLMSLSSKKSMESLSSLEPTPYNTAATCLHIYAQSGQLQVKWISSGEGNMPCFLSVNKTSSSFGYFPPTRLSIESILLLQSSVTWSHFLRSNVSTFILTS